MKKLHLKLFIPAAVMSLKKTRSVQNGDIKLVIKLVC